MDSFSTHSPSSGSSPQMSTEDFMDQLKTQLAQAYAEEFLEVGYQIFIFIFYEFYQYKGINFCQVIFMIIYPGGIVLLSSINPPSFQSKPSLNRWDAS